MTDVRPAPRRYKRGLHRFDPVKHARFKTAAHYGFTFPAATFPVDRTGGLVPAQLPGSNLGMGGNGPDPTASGVFAEFAAEGVGDCGPNGHPKNSGIITAAICGESVAANTLTTDQILALYFIYSAQQAGTTWNPSMGPPNPDWDQGVDLGDWLLWCLTHVENGNEVAAGEGLIQGFVAGDLSVAEIAGALQVGFAVIGGWMLTNDVETCFENGTQASAGPSNPPNPDDGHCFDIVALKDEAGDGTGATWGGWLLFAGSFLSDCLQQVFYVYTRQQAEDAGFPNAQVIADLKALGGTVVTPPAPGPVTPPPPAPAPVPVNPPTPVTPPAPVTPPPTPNGPPVPPHEMPPWFHRWWEDVVQWIESKFGSDVAQEVENVAEELET